MPGIRALSRLSIPAKWASITFLFLLIILVEEGIRKYLAQDERKITKKGWFFEVFEDPEIAILILLMIAIPILVYYFVWYLLLEEVSPFPDMDRIWQEGVIGSFEKGLSIQNTPIFLVLGAKNDREARNLLKLSGFDFFYATMASGEPAISVHSCNEGVFVVLNSCNRISRLASVSHPIGAGSANGLSSPVEGPTDDGRTMDATQLNEMIETRHAQPVSENPGATMLLDEDQNIEMILKNYSIPKALSSNEDVDSERRLRHLCKLINQTRLPLCPINGLLSLLPVELVESSSSHIQVALQKDLAVLREELQVRCPNTALVTGLESDDGFIELIRRLPPQQAADNRFGEGADLWVVPDSSRLDAIAAHATGKFEDWIYKLFQQENSANKKGNSKLFMLLCRARGSFAANLRSILAGGFGFDVRSDPHLAREQFLFGGCYFAATGSSPATQGFVRSVFNKLTQQEGEIEWAPRAQYLDQKYQKAASFAALVGTIALVSIVVMVVMKYFENFV
jgi:hypothetical protein